MDLNRSILKDIRLALGLGEDVTDFDKELIPHINNAIGNLNQNGIGKMFYIQHEEDIWSELLDPTQVDGNKFFHMIPQYITLSTKLLFDPPPPSSVEQHSIRATEILWRLKIAYEEPYVAVIATGGE